MGLHKQGDIGLLTALKHSHTLPTRFHRSRNNKNDNRTKAKHNFAFHYLRFSLCSRHKFHHEFLKHRLIVHANQQFNNAAGAKRMKTQYF